MVWWIWILLGFVLLGLEATTTSLHLGFFGAGAVVVGMLVGAGLLDPPWSQWLAFSVISVASMAFLRRPLMKRLKLDTPGDDIDTMIGDIAIANDDIAPGAIGKAEMRGSNWSARNVGDQLISRGERCPVEKIEGLTILVRSSKNH